MIALPVSVRDSPFLIPPERFWIPERVKEMKDQWGKWDSSEARAAVSSEYPGDEGMRALMWYDCMAIATRTDRAVSCFCYRSNALGNLLSDFRVVNRVGVTARGKSKPVASGVGAMHGLTRVEIHTPYTSRHCLLPKGDSRVSLFGNKDQGSNDFQSSCLYEARQKWDAMMKSPTSDFTEKLSALTQKRLARSRLGSRTRLPATRMSRP